jgi:ABC-2 type transport system permease protein
MNFKSNFLLWIRRGIALVRPAVELHQRALPAHRPHRHWTKWQVVMLIGASHFIQQIFQAFFLVNCTNLSELVRTGKLDFLLLLPVNTRFVVSLRQVDLGASSTPPPRGRDGLCRAPTAPGPFRWAGAGFLAAVRGRAL